MLMHPLQGLWNIPQQQQQIVWIPNLSIWTDLWVDFALGHTGPTSIHPAGALACTCTSTLSPHHWLYQLNRRSTHGSGHCTDAFPGQYGCRIGWRVSWLAKLAPVHYRSNNSPTEKASIPTTRHPYPQQGSSSMSGSALDLHMTMTRRCGYTQPNHS